MIYKSSVRVNPTNQLEEGHSLVFGDNQVVNCQEVKTVEIGKLSGLERNAYLSRKRKFHQAGDIYPALPFLNLEMLC